MAKVLITGGTGLIGQHLCNKLSEKGYDVVVLSRKKVANQKFETSFWDVDKKEVDVDLINSVDFIVHLAGLNIGDKRWTANRKKLLINSRIDSGELLFSAVYKPNNNLKAFITASAIGCYGAVTSPTIFNEDSPFAKDFLGVICKKWEEVADKFGTIGVRTVKIRTGVVLTKKGGALSKLSLPIKLGIGSAIGTGKQYLPWIHIDDLCNIYIKAIEDTHMNGAYNAVAPEHTTNTEFVNNLCLTLKKPCWFPKIPAFILQIILGELSVMLLKGSRVSSKKIEMLGHQFLYPSLKKALSNLLLA